MYSPFFPLSKFSLFHNYNVFGSCIIHMLCTGCTKIKKLFQRQKVKMGRCVVVYVLKVFAFRVRRWIVTFRDIRPNLAKIKNVHLLGPFDPDRPCTVEIYIYPDAGYTDRFGPSRKYIENSTKLTCLEITCYPMKCSTVLWLL